MNFISSSSRSLRGGYYIPPELVALAAEERRFLVLKLKPRDETDANLDDGSPSKELPLKKWIWTNIASRSLQFDNLYKRTPLLTPST